MVQILTEEQIKVVETYQSRLLNTMQNALSVSRDIANSIANEHNSDDGGFLSPLIDAADENSTSINEAIHNLNMTVENMVHPSIGGWTLRVNRVAGLSPVMQDVVKDGGIFGEEDKAITRSACDVLSKKLYQLRNDFRLFDVIDTDSSMVSHKVADRRSEISFKITKSLTKLQATVLLDDLQDVVGEGVFIAMDCKEYSRVCSTQFEEKSKKWLDNIKWD